LTRINIEGSEGIVEKLNIKGVPTFVLFYHGEIISSFTGALTYDGLNDFIEDAIQYQSNQLNG
jgi:thioredoxin-like negative regulator of GroEL